MFGNYLLQNHLATMAIKFPTKLPVCHQWRWPLVNYLYTGNSQTEAIYKLLLFIGQIIIISLYEITILFTHSECWGKAIIRKSYHKLYKDGKYSWFHCIMCME